MTIPSNRQAERAISKEGILWLTMVLTTIIIGASFYFADTFLSFNVAIIMGATGFIVTIVLNIAFFKIRWFPVVSIFIISAFIGVSYSIFFIKFDVSKTYFYLAIVADLLIVAVILYLKMVIRKNVFKRILFFILMLEILAAILLGVFAQKAPNILWGLFFGELNIIFMTLSVFVMLSETKDITKIFREIAICYLLGYVYIFVIAIAIALCMAFEDGEPLSMVGEIFACIVEGSFDGNKKKSL